MKTFKYRWKKGGKEFIGTWIEKWRSGLEEDIKSRGGELIEILEEVGKVNEPLSDLFLGDEDSLNLESKVGKNPEKISSQETILESNGKDLNSNSVNEIKETQSKREDRNNKFNFWNKPLSSWQSVIVFLALTIIALYLVVLIYGFLTAWLHPSEDDSIKRGKVYYKQGNYDLAVSEFTKAININPKNTTTYINRGQSYFKGGNLDQAITDFENVIALDPDNAMAYNEAAYMLYREGRNLDDGIALIDKALSLYPNNGIYLSTKAELLYKLGRYSEAFEYIKKGISFEPNQPEIQRDYKMIDSALYNTNTSAVNSIIETSNKYYLDMETYVQNYRKDIIYGFNSLNECNNTLNSLKKQNTIQMDCLSFDNKVEMIFKNQQVNSWYLRIDPNMKLGMEMAELFSFRNNPDDESMKTIASEDMKAVRQNQTQQIEGLLISPDGRTWNF